MECLRLILRVDDHILQSVFENCFLRERYRKCAAMAERLRRENCCGGFGLNSCIKNVIVMKEKKSVKSKIFRFYAGSGVL